MYHTHERLLPDDTAATSAVAIERVVSAKSFGKLKVFWLSSGAGTLYAQALRPKLNAGPTTAQDPDVAYAIDTNANGIPDSFAGLFFTVAVVAATPVIFTIDNDALGVERYRIGFLPSQNGTIEIADLTRIS